MNVVNVFNTAILFFFRNLLITRFGVWIHGAQVTIALDGSAH